MPPPTPGKSSAPATGRITRLRSAKDPAGTNSPLVDKPSLLARGKEGFRKVSAKIQDKDNGSGSNSSLKSKQAIVATTSIGSNSKHSESLQAFLRIRPSPVDEASHVRPYLEPQGDKDVIMRAPTDIHRPHIPKPPHIYSFDRVFSPSTPQSAFFTNTTLPLVEGLLKGENGLLFAYGVSNSGKSYSISGGSSHTSEERGVLPRAIDVVFNSIQGMESRANLRCVGMADVEIAREADPPVLEGFHPDFESLCDESIKVDRNFSYAVFVSSAEVYNEKIFDLLDNILPISASSSKPAHTRPSSQLALNGAYGSSMSFAAMANGGGGVLKRRALVLKNDPEGNGKYVSGMNEVRVRTRQEALVVIRAGQRARQVFGTLANRESSRSHGIFTIKIVRVHNGAPEDPDSAQVSRLSIVDLAGSERTRNTGTTGDRLKEAGSINKSLMVLGQCLEVLRANQQRLAGPTISGMKKKLAVVPFRHSKLTEIFQNFFVGDGRAVMIVHVNPYDTGFDENSHVMRFSAIARDIQTTASNKSAFPLLKRQISTQFSAIKQAIHGPMKIKVVVPVLPKDVKSAERSIPVGKDKKDRESEGFVLVEEELEVVEEDVSDDESQEDETDWLVEHLFEQLREAKQRLYESEMRNASIEVEVREEAAQEMQDAMVRMQADFARLLQDQVAASEMKTDRKLDILSRAIPTPGPSRGFQRDQGTPMSDVTEEDHPSFATDLDSEYIHKPRERLSDPFLVQDSPGRVERDERDAGSEGEVDDVLKPSSSRATVRPRFSQESGIDSDDPLVATDIEPTADQSLVESEQQEDDGELTASESESETEDAEEEEEIEEERDTDGAGIDEDEEDDDYSERDDEEQADAENDSVEDESSFAISEDDSEPEAVSSSASSSPVKRGTGLRRTSGSPTKPRTSTAKKAPLPRTTSKHNFKTPARVKSTQKPTPASARGVLAERLLTQEANTTTDEADEEDEVIVAAPSKAKKKRTLGKKIITEDEMLSADSPAPGSEVRRMVKRGL